MKILAISLVTAVFVATVGLGRLFDYIFVQYIQDDSNRPLSSISAIEKFGSDLRVMLASSNRTSDELTKLIAEWPTDGNYKLSILPMKSVLLPEDLKHELVSGKPLTLASEDDVATYYYLDNNQQLLMLTSPLMEEGSSSSLSRYLFTSLFYLCLLSLMLLWIYPLLKRLLALRAMTKAFGQGDLQKRVKVGSVSYIRDLEQEFNHMAQRISDLVGDVKLLSSAVSHDLRTPLATIRFGIDTLQEEDDPVLRKKFEQRISNNVDEMIELVEILLNYARLDQSLVTLDKTEFELNPLLSQIVNNQPHEQIQFELLDTNDMPVSVFADKKYLSMLLKNLVQNAVQHCNQNIRISVGKQTDWVLISVADDGEGIDESLRDQIIKPFVRGKAEHKGYGIGLAIVQRILHWHNGQLKISEDDNLGGAKFSVLLPNLQ